MMIGSRQALADLVIDDGQTFLLNNAEPLNNLTLIL